MLQEILVYLILQILQVLQDGYVFIGEKTQ